MVQVARNQKPGSVPVYLNVYDLTHINGYAYWLGLGIYHSGVQVHGWNMDSEHMTMQQRGFLRLTQKPIPRWVNRLARLGLFCNCVLPAGLNETKLRQVQSKNSPFEEETRKLRWHSSRFPYFSTSIDVSSSRFLRSLSRNSGQRQCLPTPSSLTHSASITNPSFKT
ncbi:hypothetical protein MLD38_014575 [Melastoma candidum]|uniref:Uncharacterized protein n=1 Tax=Melastoma candidum TaxID=119954 RepID=A0ACB9RDT4_9MYRT|nr:hypothetical protein MLD38_014575 [Melastoma candidum]